MLVSPKDLTELLSASWTAAQEGPYELREQAIEDILANFLNHQQKPWAKLKFEEWLGLPSGRKIFHSLFGEGVITIKGGERFVSFRGFRMELLEAGWPWDHPVQLL